MTVPPEESLPVSYRLSKLLPPVIRSPEPSVVAAVWVSVEVRVDQPVLVPISVSVDVTESVAVTLLNVDDSVVVAVAVTVLGWLSFRVRVLRSQTAWTSLAPVGKPLELKVSLLDSVDVSW